MGYSKYNIEIINEIIEKFDHGINKYNLSKDYNISFNTIKYWINNRDKILDTIHPIKDVNDYLKDKYKCYSYILGMYLGDGHINKIKNSYKIRIVLDKKYFNIVQECSDNLKELFNNSTINIKPHKNTYIVSLNSCNLLKLFPQSDVGYKYNRDVSLKDFQINIIDDIHIIKGLFHSDGCLYKSKTGKNGKYISFFYNFTNMSKDIVDIYCKSLDNISVKYTISKNKKSNVFKVNIYKKTDVAKLYSLIGLKNLNHKLEIDQYCNNIKTKIVKSIKPIKKINYCECGKEIKIASKRCPSCDKIKQRKVKDRPSVDELNLMIKDSSLESVGRKYGVSGNAVKKWLKMAV